jgi:hypothetical protein
MALRKESNSIGRWTVITNHESFHSFRSFGYNYLIWIPCSFCLVKSVDKDLEAVGEYTIVKRIDQ